MSAPNPTAAKPPVLSYAERAKRAGTAAPVSSATQQPSRARPAVSNGNGRVPGESVSPASTSISNIAQSSTLPAHATPSTSEATQVPPTQSGSEENPRQQQKTVPIVPKSPSKPPPTNVWAARKEQMAQRAAAQQTQAQTNVNAISNSQTPDNLVASSSTLREAVTTEASSRSLVNGNANVSSLDDPASSSSAKADDPFVVRIPPQLSSQASSIATRTPPSLDDIESWPEMGKGGPSVATSASGSVIAGSTGSDGDKKESSMSMHKKGEKTKWIAVPASELQFTTPDIHSPSHSRTHSQHRRHKPPSSRSRQQSQTRNTSGKAPGGPNTGNASGNNGTGGLSGSYGSSVSGELSVSQSRAESVVHSRTTSVHSSPRGPPRGRRLPDDQAPGVYRSLSQIVSSVNNTEPSIGPSINNAKKPPITVLPNGDITEETPDIPAPAPVDPSVSQYQQQPPSSSSYIDPSSSPTTLRSQNPSVPHSQSHTPYTSHSPVYYAPPLPMHPYMYNGLPSGGVYGAPPPPPPPAFEHQQYPHVHAQSPTGVPGQPPHGYHHYQPYPMQPYMYQPVPYPFYPLQAPGQPHERPSYEHNSNALPIQVQNQDGKAAAAENPTSNASESVNQVVEGLEKLHVQSPVLPPPSLLTHPPPPDRSAALAGYREVSIIPISPLMHPHRPTALLDAVASGSASQVAQTEQDKGEKKEEMVFGSVGRPGGIKSPSPIPAPPAGQDAIAASLLSGGETTEDATIQAHASRSNTTFAVGIDIQDAERIKLRIKRSRGDTASGRYSAVDSEKTHDGDASNDDVQYDTLLETISAVRYQFGTSSQSEDAVPTEDSPPMPQNGDVEQPQPPILQPQPHQPPILHFPPPFPPHYGGNYMMPPPGVPANMPITLPMSSPSPQALTQPLSQHIPSLHPYSMNPGFVSPLTLSSPGPNSVPASGGGGGAGGDEFLEVRDFGYGFGPMSGSGFGPERVREERLEREREREREQHREIFREPQQRDYFGGGGRGRRGNAPFDRGGGFMRRGRGGQGFRGGFARGFGGGRGGLRHQPPLNVSTNAINAQQSGLHGGGPPPQIQPSDVADGYFPPPSSQGSSPYATSPYALYNPAPLPPTAQPSRPPPPVQPPVTKLSFPLDPLRHSLLGQLEYYFSSDNLPADFFLRSKMDSRGWISIPLIATFNRIRHLTTDVQVVKDTLTLSSIVEVREDYVRLSNRQWAKYVLPGAEQSPFEDEEGDEDEDEDDVVFVLGGEASG